MNALEKGKLYQVNTRKGWIVAEYVSKCEAHTTRGYQSLTGKTEWHEPAAHYFRPITLLGPGTGSSFGLFDKGLKKDIRPVSEDTLQEITQLQQTANDLRNKFNAETKALRLQLEALCQ